jgi:hypothetical protein
MQLISELAHIVTEYLAESPEIILRSRAKKFELLPFEYIGAKDSYYYRAFNALVHGNIQEDKQLREFIFPEGTSDANFRTFKSRLKKRLLNSVMLISIDPNTVSATDAMEGEAIRLFYASYISSILNSSMITWDLSTQALNIARKFDMFYIEIRLLESLLQNSTFYGTKKEYDHYYSEWMAARKKYNLYMDVVGIEHRLSAMLREKFNIFQETIELYEQAAQALYAILQQCEFDLAYRQYYLTATNLALMKNDFEQVLSISSAYEDYLHRKPHFNSINRELYISEQKQRAYFYLGQYNASKQTMEKAMARLPESRKQLRITRALFSLHNAIYVCDCAYAVQLCDIMGKRSNIHWFTPRQRAHFILLRGFLWLEYHIGMAQASDYPCDLQAIHIQRFIAKRPLVSTILNDIPEFEKNISGGLAIARILTAILHITQLRKDIIFEQLSPARLLKKNDACIENLEALMRYIQKHIKSDTQKRVHAFTHFLCVLAQNITMNSKELFLLTQQYRDQLPPVLIPDDDELIPFGICAHFLLQWWDNCEI